MITELAFQKGCESDCISPDLRRLIQSELHCDPLTAELRPILSEWRNWDTQLVFRRHETVAPLQKRWSAERPGRPH